MNTRILLSYKLYLPQCIITNYTYTLLNVWTRKPIVRRTYMTRVYRINCIHRLNIKYEYIIAIAVLCSIKRSNRPRISAIYY